MKTYKVIIPIFIFLLLLGKHTVAQQWVDMMLDPKVNFYDVQKEFNSYWNGKVIPRSKGWKQFKRWEDFVAPRVYPTGNRIDNLAAWNAYYEYKKTHQTKALTFTSSNWKALGPFAPPTGGGEAGRVNCIAYHPTNASIIYAGSPGGGLWVTTNGGGTWGPLTDNLPDIGVSDIVVDYSNPSTIYIATGDGDGNDTYTIGILKSTDGGATFNTTGLTWPVTMNRLISKILINPLNPNSLFAATSYGILKTTDAGATWHNLTFDFTRDICFKPGDTTIMYAATKNLFYKSIDGGAHFSFKNLPITGYAVSRIEIGVTPANPNYVYILTGNNADQSFGGIYRSTDAGETFTTRTTTPNILDWSTDGSGTGGQAWYDLSLAVSKTNAEEVYTGGVNIWKSTNGGTSLSIVAHWYGANNKPYVHADVHCLRFSPSNVLYAGTDGGVSNTSNGGSSWTTINNGFSIGQMYRLSASVTNPAEVITGWQDNGTNLLNGTWKQVVGGDGMDCIIDYSNPTYMYASLPNGSLQASTNGGSNFSNISSNLPTPDSGAWVTPIAIHPTVPATIYAGFTNVWKSTNRGHNWTKISSFYSPNYLKTLVIAPSNANYIYAATDNIINKTTDGGTTWTIISNGLPGNAITGLTISSSDPNIIWVTLSGYTTGQKVYTTRDGGTTWTNYSGTLPNIPANCIKYVNQSKEALYIGMDVGIYYTDSTMSDWVLYNNNLPNVIIDDLEISYSTNKIKAATFGRGLWETPMWTSPNSIEEHSKDVETLSFFPSPTTGIVNFNIPLSAVRANIIVYNAIGATIISKEINLNSNTYQLDVSDQAEGTYFVNLTIKGTKYIGKFVKINK